MESGEGIENFLRESIGHGLIRRWNPVKELKGCDLYRVALGPLAPVVESGEGIERRGSPLTAA